MMSFGERFEELLTKNNLSGRELAAKIGVTTGSISNWRHGSFPSADKACDIARVLGVTVEYLVNGEEPPEALEFHDPSSGKSVRLMPGKDDFLVPVLGQRLSAGGGCPLPEDDSPTGYMPVPQSLRQYGERIALLAVNGDSMEPTLRNGDQVVCDACGWDSGEGLYAIRMNGSGYVKRIQAATGRFIIKSDNPRYDTMTEPMESDDIQIIGKVHYVIKHVS